MSRSGFCAEASLGLLLISHIHSNVSDRHNVGKISGKVSSLNGFMRVRRDPYNKSLSI